MGRIVVKQPNGKYSVWSTVVDNFIIIDATEKEIADSYIEEKVEEIRKDVSRSISKADSKSDDEVYKYLEKIKELHGGDEYKEVIRMMGVENK